MDSKPVSYTHLDVYKRQAYNHAVQIDKAIEAKYPYAFDERFGYLTACPTNVGTGLQASVMLHLPALTLSGRIRDSFVT